MSIYIETPRFFIRELLPEDAKGMFGMDSDPEVHRFVGKKPVQSIEQSMETILFVRKQYEDYGIGRWAIVEKSSGEFAGWTGFKFMHDAVNKHINHYDFGYRLARRMWGKGVATETGRAALDYGIDSLGFRDIYAMTHVDNGASRHVLEKLGFQLVELFIYDAHDTWQHEGALTTWYKLTDARIMQ